MSERHEPDRASNRVEQRGVFTSELGYCSSSTGSSPTSRVPYHKFVRITLWRVDVNRLGLVKCFFLSAALTRNRYGVDAGHAWA
jgi:hypothetical protein